MGFEKVGSEQSAVFTICAADCQLPTPTRSLSGVEGPILSSAKPSVFLRILSIFTAPKITTLWPTILRHRSQTPTTTTATTCDLPKASAVARPESPSSTPQYCTIDVGRTKALSTTAKQRSSATENSTLPSGRKSRHNSTLSELSINGRLALKRNSVND